MNTRENFYLCVDHDGKIPRRMSYPCTRYFVRYVSNKPIVVSPYEGQDTVWDYSQQKMLALKKGIRHWNGNPMEMYSGEIVDNIKA